MQEAGRNEIEKRKAEAAAGLKKAAEDRVIAEKALAEAVARVLRARPWTRSRITVSSFDLGALAALRERMPEQPLAVLYEEPPADWPMALSGLKATGLHIWREFVTAEVLKIARETGFHVRVYTVNDRASMAPHRGGLAGIITDHPPLFLSDPAWAAWEAGTFSKPR